MSSAELACAIMEPAPSAVPRFCRWCAGDGLDPFLPTRIRQFFTRSPFFVVEAWTEFAGSFKQREERTLWLAYVSAYGPFNEFLEDTSDELRGRSDVIYTPFDLVGRTYHALRCRRCRGTGRRTGESEF